MASQDKTEAGDAPLIDLNDASIRKLIARAKRRGVITYDELNEALPQDQMSSEQIEDIMAAISEMGVNIVESDEDTLDPEEKEADEADEPEDVEERPDLVKKKEVVERTDDPVRMYLREMGAVELLSREGEIAIAKRIEAGRETMIAGLCESPLTFQAIIIWRDELNEGNIMLREIVDLEATYAGPDGKNPSQIPGEGAEPGVSPAAAAEGETPEGELPSDLDDDDMENNVSLSAMEAELKPRVLETFDSIADNYKNCLLYTSDAADE